MGTSCSTIASTLQPVQHFEGPVSGSLVVSLPPAALNDRLFCKFVLDELGPGNVDKDYPGQTKKTNIT